MKLKNKSFSGLFDFKTPNEKYRHDADILMFKFLSEVEQLMKDENITRKDLAKRIDTSPSYITQLFRGTKLINLITLAKIQDALEIEFNVNRKGNKHDSVTKGEIEEYLKNNRENYFIYFKNPNKENSKESFYRDTSLVGKKIAS